MALMTTLAIDAGIAEVELILSAAHEVAERGQQLVEIGWFYQLPIYTQERIIDHLESLGYNVTFEHRREDLVDILKVAW